MKQQPINVLIFEDQPDTYRWVEASLLVCGIKVNAVPAGDASVIESDKKKGGIVLKNYDLLLISENLFPKVIAKLKMRYSLRHIPVPILVLTEGFGTLNEERFRHSPTDYLPKPVLTLPLLKHAIESLLSDFNKTKKLTRMAHFDSLTGAANRHLFNDRLKQTLIRSKRYKEPMALLYFDLDKFKQVNDTFGHDAGDRLLICFVQTLRDCIRETDTICRQGGDEFSVLLLHITQDGAIDIAKSILSDLEREKDILGHSLRVQTSIGIACLTGSEDKDSFRADSITSRADKAVYLAKAEGRNRFCVA